MRKAVTVFFILMFLLATAELASAHGQYGRYRGQRYGWRTHRHPRRVRVLGVRYYRPVYYYGQRRRVYVVHRRNAARRYWHRRAQERRWWLRHHRRVIR